MKNRNCNILRFIIVLFSLCAHIQAQTITSLAPNSAILGQTIDVLIQGMSTHFQNGVSRADLGQDITVQKFVVANAQLGTATIQISNNAQLGQRTVKVTTGTETVVMTNAFEVFSATGSFKANFDVLPLQSISLSDLDLTNPPNAPIMFFVNIYNDNTLRNINISITLNSSSNGNLGKMSTTYNNLSPNGYVRLSNRSFTNVDLNGAAGQQFLKSVQALGTFPPDNYSYQLSVTDDKGNILATGSTSTSVTNPISTPELITPGQNFNHVVEKVYNPLPLFQWFGQNGTYDLALYEVMPNQTAEDVVRNVAQFKKTDITGNSFLYPNYAEKLQNGKTYAWQVQGKAPTTKGVKYVPSELFRFQYVDLGSGNNNMKNIATVRVMPQEITLVPGQQYQFTIIAKTSDSSIIQNATAQWQVAPSDKGTISNTGLFTAGKNTATFAVVVNAGTVSDYATVNITPNVSALPNVNPNGLDMNAMISKLFGLPK